MRRNIKKNSRKIAKKCEEKWEKNRGKIIEKDRIIKYRIKIEKKI